MDVKITGKDKKLAIEFIKKKYPIGTSIWDHTCSSNYIIKKDSVYEIFTDNDASAESYTIMVRNKGKDSPLYLINTIFKNWILDYIKRY
jgi:hypothetical protein